MGYCFGMKILQISVGCRPENAAVLASSRDECQAPEFEDSTVVRVIAVARIKKVALDPVTVRVFFYLPERIWGQEVEGRG